MELFVAFHVYLLMISLRTALVTEDFEMTEQAGRVTIAEGHLPGPPRGQK